MKLHVVFAMLLASASSNAAKFADWTTGFDDSGTPYMYTSNESGAVIGKWCDIDDESCFWLLLSPDTNCDEGAQVPILISAPAGARSTVMTCTKPAVLGKKTYSRNMIHGPDDMDGLLAKSGRLGLAIAMTSGDFRAMRFSLNGGSEALAAFSSAMSAAYQAKKRGTKDMKL